MSGSIQFNPMLTSNISGSFAATTSGFIQGAANDDPTVRNLLQGGPLASTETIPMWGGVAVSTYIPQINAGPLGPQVKRALTNANITGFSVYNQIGNALVTPGGNPPLLYTGQKTSFYYLGSNARIPLQIDPALVSQDGNITSTQFSWDFTAQRLTLYSPAYAQQTPTAYTYTSSSGALALTFTTAPGVQVGQYVTLAGFTGANIGLNGDWAVLSTASAGTVVTVQATAGLGSLTPTGGYLVAGGGAVPIKQVQQIKSDGCKTITYNPSTGAVSWNENGAVALCLI